MKVIGEKMDEMISYTWANISEGLEDFVCVHVCVHKCMCAPCVCVCVCTNAEAQR